MVTNRQRVERPRRLHVRPQSPSSLTRQGYRRLKAAQQPHLITLYQTETARIIGNSQSTERTLHEDRGRQLPHEGAKPKNNDSRQPMSLDIMHNRSIVPPYRTAPVDKKETRPLGTTRPILQHPIQRPGRNTRSKGDRNKDRLRPGITGPVSPPKLNRKILTTAHGKHRLRDAQK